MIPKAVHLSFVKITFITLWLFAISMLCQACKTKKDMPPKEDKVEVPQTFDALTENTTHLQNSKLAPFFHGVASGDPYPNSVVLWTRVTPKSMIPKIEVSWEIATDESFENIVNKGKVMTGSKRDYTVKVIADGLDAGTKYFYRFKSFGKVTPIGQTKTASEKDDLKLAVVSCSNVEFGYFNAYAAIAKEELDVVLHLGDYIYEYGPDVYGDKEFARKNIPAHEILSLQDYRDRYSQYRLDRDLQEVHRVHPFINIWDDHEITNNAYVEGAQNHQEGEGDYTLRKNIAKQVFYEWLPIREEGTHYRKFSYGSNLDILMLDERLAGRTMQADSISDPRRNSKDHKLLGDKQLNWLINHLEESNAQWKLIGNQVVFSYCDWGYDRFSLNMDAWDGYPVEQNKLAEAVSKKGIENLVFVTGDTHTAWAFEATHKPFDGYDEKTGEGAIGVEFGVTSINSGNANERSPDDEVKAHEKKIANSNINPHLKYVNMRDHGYLLLHISEDQLEAQYKTIGTLKERNSNTKIDKVFKVNKGSSKLEPVK